MSTGAPSAIRSPKLSTTIMLDEQNVPRAHQLSHRGYVLENGRLVLDGTRASLLASPHVKQAYLGL